MSAATDIAWSLKSDADRLRDLETHLRATDLGKLIAQDLERAASHLETAARQAVRYER